MQEPLEVRLFAEQSHLDELLEKNSEGSLTPSEAVELARFVAEAEESIVANMIRLAELYNS